MLHPIQVFFVHMNIIMAMGYLYMCGLAICVWAAHTCISQFIQLGPYLYECMPARMSVCPTMYGGMLMINVRVYYMMKFNTFLPVTQ